MWLLRVFGWKITGIENAHKVDKSVIAVAPHTSWADFPLGILVRCAARLPSKYLGKKSLFRPPLGIIFRALGGYPVDRSKAQNQVAQVVEIFNEHDTFSVAMSPEGTRDRVDRFKRGFYYIAKGAGAAIVMCTFDFAKKTVEFSPTFWPTDDSEADIAHVENHFRGIVGHIAERSFY